MGSPTALAALGRTCKRYGPGRLPGAERPDIGAGYAGASAALLAAITWMVVLAALTAVGVAEGFPGTGFLALYAIPLVVPVAFVAGVLVWRVLPPETPHFGAIAGLLGTLSTYAGSVLVLAVVFPVLLGGVFDPAVVLGVRVAVAYGLVGLALTFWVALPVGTISGAIYERVGAEPVERER